MVKNVEERTIGEAKQLIAEADELRKVFGMGNPPAGTVSGGSHSFKIGQKVLIRAVTYHYIGRVEEVTDTDVKLGEASWLACSNRWHETLKTGEVSEIEPYPNACYVARGAIVDWCEWDHELPRVAK